MGRHGRRHRHLDRRGRPVDRGVGGGSDAPVPEHLRRPLARAGTRRSYVVLFLLVRSRLASFRASLWLDGVDRGAVRHRVARSRSLTSRSSMPPRAPPRPWRPTSPTRSATCCCSGVVVAVFGLTGWRPGRAWLILGAGLALTRIADVIYLVQTASGTYAEGSLLDARLARLFAADRPGGVAAGKAGSRAGRGPARGRCALRLRRSSPSRC